MATYYRWRKSQITHTDQISTMMSNRVTLVNPVYVSPVFTGDDIPFNSETGEYGNGLSTGGRVEKNKWLQTTYNRDTGLHIAISQDYPVTEYYVADDPINGTLNISVNSNSLSITTFNASLRRRRSILSAGTFVEYVYSESSTAYPNRGVSGNYYYDQRSTITINITVPSMVMQGQDIPVSWNTVSGATEYFLERQADGGSWTQVYNGSTNSYTDTAGAWSNVKYRLRMTISGTMTPYVESSTCQVVDASTLAISGTDGDLGTLTNDVEYTVISDGDSAITVTEAVEGVYTNTFTATAGATNKISVLDLLTGTGSIRITASTNLGSSVIEVERSWTYSKTAAMFSAYGNTAELKRNGVPVWPLTLAECVRLPGGETLDVGMLRVEIGWYQGTNTYGASNPTSISFSGKPYLVFITSGAFNSLINPLVRRSNSNATSAATFAASSSSIQSISATWGDNSVSWYSTSSAQGQLNGTGGYHYLALLLGGDE